MFRIAHWPGHCVLRVLSLLGGCLVLGPGYQRPALAPGDVSATWTSAAATVDASVPAAQWWRELSAPVLEELIDHAFRDSPTAEPAMARLREARAASTRAGVESGSGAAERGDARQTWQQHGRSDKWIQQRMTGQPQQAHRLLERARHQKSQRICHPHQHHSPGMGGRECGGAQGHEGLEWP